ncbi:hypothetical protein [Natrinema halophilum]|uniref:hypothetical protein n=1 Tax=Natrinema halophilum TaxID=1699371 RepID=UPI001F2F8D93|nr:hypothetical protein [Natrinema halophilum]UHQ95984.1 hypothetical protein HYG82_21145 [Natrinema halophilum]
MDLMLFSEGHRDTDELVESIRDRLIDATSTRRSTDREVIGLTRVGPTEPALTEIQGGSPRLQSWEESDKH